MSSSTTQNVFWCNVLNSFFPPQHPSLNQRFLKMTRCRCGFLKSHMESFKRCITEDDKNASSDRNNNRYLIFLSHTKTTFFQRLYFKEKTSFLILRKVFCIMHIPLYCSKTFKSILYS